MLTELSFGHVIKAVHVAKASALMEELQRSVEALNFSVMLVGRSMIQPKPNFDETESGSITVQLIETLGRGKGRSIGLKSSYALPRSMGDALQLWLSPKIDGSIKSIGGQCGLCDF
ncbi:unnamed protein product [Rhizophagus irregularis]|nr:unnamed protein product [Rhizophagus irregularis]